MVDVVSGALRIAVISVVLVGAAFAGEVEPRSGGKLAVADAKTTLVPLAYDSEWKRIEGKGNGRPEQDGSFSLRIADTGGTILDGRAKFKEGTGTVAASWQMKAQRDWRGNGVFVSADFPVDIYDGGWIAWDGEQRTLTSERGKADPTLFHGAASKFSIYGKGGKPSLALDFPRPVRVRLQDNRKWGGKSYSLRLELAKEQFHAGDEFRMSCSLSTGEALSLMSTKEETITAGADWIPIDGKGEAMPGSALDFSQLCGERKPAGAFGRVVRNGGHFEFEQLPGVAQRFYGVNLCGSANVPPFSQARPFAARLARMGYNAVRVHHHENALTKADGFTLDDKRNEAKTNDIPDIIKRFHNLDEEESRTPYEKSFFVTKQDIVDNDYVLSLNKYQKKEIVKKEYRPTAEILKSICDLETQFKELMDEISKGIE